MMLSWGNKKSRPIPKQLHGLLSSCLFGFRIVSWAPVLGPSQQILSSFPLKMWKGWAQPGNGLQPSWVEMSLSGAAGCCLLPLGTVASPAPPPEHLVSSHSIPCLPSPLPAQEDWEGWHRPGNPSFSSRMFTKSLFLCYTLKKKRFLSCEILSVCFTCTARSSPLLTPATVTC